MLKISIVSFKSLNHEFSILLLFNKYSVIEKYVKDVKQDEQKRTGSCGIDNEAIWCCKTKRRVTPEFGQNDTIYT